MKTFHCDHGRHLLFCENVDCVKCSHALAYLPELGVMGSLEPASETPASEGLWRTPILRSAGQTYKLCENYSAHNICNWAVPADHPHALCISCRLTRVIPDLSRPAHKPAWYELEVAKRRLVDTLAALKLPLLNKTDDPEHGLAFEFPAGPEDPAAPRLLTGHAGGVITINIAEADDPERETRRVQFHEPYRTLLGHFRHEVGHYYWERLIRDDRSRLESFRSVFGDERVNYADAMKRHYQVGAPTDWQNRFISACATHQTLVGIARTDDSGHVPGGGVRTVSHRPAGPRTCFQWLQLSQHSFERLLVHGLGQVVPDSRAARASAALTATYAARSRDRLSSGAPPRRRSKSPST